jgi:hypothetical protein
VHTKTEYAGHHLKQAGAVGVEFEEAEGQNIQIYFFFKQHVKTRVAGG